MNNKYIASTQVTVLLDNVPGSLNKVLGYLAEYNINLLGITSESLGNTGIVRLIVDNQFSQKVAVAFTKYNISFTTTPVLVSLLTNKPGELLQLTKFLAGRNINITSVYGTAFGDTSAIVLGFQNVNSSPSDIETVIKDFYPTTVAVA